MKIPGYVGQIIGPRHIAAAGVKLEIFQFFLNRVTVASNVNKERTCIHEKKTLRQRLFHTAEVTANTAFCS